MQDDQSPGDKPHDPSPRKLEEARRKGEIVRSADLNTAIAYGGFLLASMLVLPWAVRAMGDMSRVIWGQANDIAPQVLSPGGLALSGGLIWPAALGLAVLTIVPVGLILAALLAQRAVIFTPDNLLPKLSRISPISNGKQKYGPHGLFQFAKSAVKLAIVSTLLGLFLVLRADEILTALYAAPGQILMAMGRLGFEFLVVVTALSAAIAVVDWMWEWHRHQTKNRMSRQELMDETKGAEGDPYMKQQRRQKGQALAMNRMLADVPNADVVIVNPTHYAVALTWDRAQGGVPVCVAKGVDETARRIREIAAESAVPVLSDPPTARALHASVEIGAPITSDHFRAVAAAIRFADAMRQKARRSVFGNPT